MEQQIAPAQRAPKKAAVLQNRFDVRDLLFENKFGAAGQRKAAQRRPLFGPLCGSLT
jgi:hypothetical protein